MLSQTELRSVYEGLPEAVGDTRLVESEVSFADKSTYYWPESVVWPKGNKQPALEFANAATCTMHLTEITLIYHGLKMRLIFNVDIDRTQPDRRLVIDSLPFRTGTFVLNLKGWPGGRDKMIPANRWKRARRPRTAE